MSPALVAVRSDQPLTVLEAIAWCWPTPGDREVIGFGYSPDAAPWWRLREGQPVGPDGPCDLGNVYELVAFDGDRELRWLQTGSSRGPAVVLAEEGVELPAGTAVTDWAPTDTDDSVSDDSDTRDNPSGGSIPRTRPIAFGIRRHWLADHPSRLPGAWTRLSAVRYRPVPVPIALPTGERPWNEYVIALSSVEYTIEDQHGNLSVIETRLTGLDLIERTPQRSPSGKAAS